MVTKQQRHLEQRRALMLQMNLSQQLSGVAFFWIFISMSRIVENERAYITLMFHIVLTTEGLNELRQQQFMAMNV